MKGINIGILSVYSDDGDDFDNLLDVIKRAYELNEIEPWTTKLFQGLKRFFKK